MICKFCNAEIEEACKVCPICGRNLAEEAVAEEPVAEEIVVEETPVEELTSEETEMTEETAEGLPEEAPKKRIWPLVLAIVGAVVALGVLAVVLLTALGVDLLPRANDIMKKDNYTVSDKAAVRKAEAVVATIGDKQLTNAQLQIYYRMQVVDFLNYYGSYVSQVGLDYTEPLSEQNCYFEKDLTWEQYFLNIAIETWQNYQTLVLMAEEAGHTLSADWQESLEKLPEDLEKQAKDEEYESVDAMLADVIGPGCTLDVYMEYIKVAYLSNDYYNTQYDKLKPTDEEAEAYFAENEKVFAENGITKDSGLISSVRHILLFPEGGKKDETTGATTYSQKEWDACLKKAEKILEQWKDAGAKQEEFIKLVEEHSEDGGSNESGGLYEGIYKNSGMVEPFEAWCIDPARKPGDTGIVKADFDHYKGYHIIYFVSGEPHWLDSARTNFASDRTTEMLDNALAKWPMRVKYGKIALADLEL